MRLLLFFVICLHALAIILVGMGFFVLRKMRKIENVGASNNDIGPCDTLQPRVPIKNFVLFVLDAFRDEFFFEMDALKETRKLVQNGEAIAFKAHTQYPTVTMPRIKSITSGSVPLFSDLLMNFASTEFREDTWLDGAKEHGKRLVFYGDDTWIKMFPTAHFENRSEGVTSFYVTDYTDVDNAVTRNLHKELTAPDSWDVLVLHYIGLDHVGHSLGSESPQIRIKLNEMDQIIANITRTLARQRRADGEFAVMVLGDHGMTVDGGHGGNTPRETHVPVILIKKGMEKLSDKGLLKPDMIEQVDVVPTIASLLGLNRLPYTNLGISFFSKVEAARGMAAASIQRNAKQFIEILLSEVNPLLRSESDKAMKSLNRCVTETTRFCAENGGKTAIKTGEPTVARLFDECQDSMRQIQRKLLIQSSNHDDNYILAGILFCALGFISLVCLSFGGHLRCPTPEVFKLVFIHPLLFFSSSFVEEEHDFWFFLLPLFIAYMIWMDLSEFRKVVGKDFWRSPKLSFFKFVWRERWSLFVLVCNRAAVSSLNAKHRRWLLFGNERVLDFGLSFNADAVSINIRTWLFVGTFFAEHLQHVWSVLTMVVVNFWHIYRSVHLLRYNSVPAFLGLAAVFALKMPFNVVDSVYLERFLQVTVVWLFLTCNFSFAFPLWILFIAKPQFFHLVLLSWAIGYALGRIRTRSVDEAGYLLHAAISTSFFYMGNSNGIATIDIAPGYVGLPAYLPLLVATQILLNAYMCPIFVFIGWYRSMSAEQRRLNILFEHGDAIGRLTANSNATSKTLHVLRALVTLRSGALLAALVVAHHFRFHLFVWSVFMPKILCEVVHFAAVAGVALGATMLLVDGKRRRCCGRGIGVGGKSGGSDGGKTDGGNGGGAILLQ